MIRNIRNFAILLFILGVGSFILYVYDKINLIYLIVINLSIGFIEMGLILLILRSIKIDLLPNTRILIPKGKIDHKLIVAKTKIFQKNIMPTNPIKESIFRVSVELSEKIEDPLEFSIMRTCDTNFYEEKVDATNCLNDGLHSLNIRIRPKEKLNFMFDKNVNVKVFEVEEFYIP